MRIVLALALIAAATPAVAQVWTVNVPSAAGLQEFGRLNADPPMYRDGVAYGRDTVFERNVRRAGAWGQCVVGAAPADSRAYLTSAQTTALLRWSFQRCQRKVGFFDGADLGRVRRAALIDALRSA